MKRGYPDAVLPVSDDVAAVCLREVHRLHRAIVDWTTGAVPDDDRSFAPFAEAFAPTFLIINPEGAAESVSSVVSRFRKRHGERAALDFGIRITDEDVRLVTGKQALIVYQEHWLHGTVEQSVILASALLEVDAARPGGVAWLHLHETWLRPPR